MINAGCGYWFPVRVKGRMRAGRTKKKLPKTWFRRTRSARIVSFRKRRLHDADPPNGGRAIRDPALTAM